MLPVKSRSAQVIGIRVAFEDGVVLFVFGPGDVMGGDVAFESEVALVG
jgi:hypothetical protein